MLASLPFIPSTFVPKTFAGIRKQMISHFDKINVPYVFDTYKEFPTRKRCSTASFTAYKNVLKMISNILLGADIVNSLWLIIFSLIVVYQTIPIFVLNLVISLTSLIFGFMIAYIYDQPGEIKGLVRSCFYPSSTAWGGLREFRVLSWGTIAFRVVQLIVFFGLKIQ
jgi:hypothetical protein